MSAEVLFGPEPQTVKWTEAMLLDRLRTRYGRTYTNGSYVGIRYIGASHVRALPGPGSGNRIADYLAIDCWRGYGDAQHPLLGFEVKVSRSDYLAEIRDISKSEPFREVCTEWYVVASDKSIVRDDLPEGWGLMVARGDGLACVRRSAVNPDPKPVPRSLLAGFLRAAVMQAGASS